MAHRPIWPCAKRTELKTFVHQQFYGTHVGTFGGNSNLHISKTMNFIFSHNTPPSHLPKPCHTDQLGHVQNKPNSKHSCTKNFIVLIWGNLEAIPTFTSQKPWISFFYKIPHQGIYLSRATPTNLAMFKTHRTQKIGAPRILRYSFGDTWRPFQTLHLKTMNFIFSQNTLPSHLPESCHTDQLGHVQNTSNSKHWHTKNFILLISGTWRPFQPLHLKNHEFHFFTKHPTQAST